MSSSTARRLDPASTRADLPPVTGFWLDPSAQSPGGLLLLITAPARPAAVRRNFPALLASTSCGLLLPCCHQAFISLRRTDLALRKAARNPAPGRTWEPCCAGGPCNSARARARAPWVQPRSRTGSTRHPAVHLRSHPTCAADTPRGTSGPLTWHPAPCACGLRGCLHPAAALRFAWHEEFQPVAPAGTRREPPPCRRGLNRFRGRTLLPTCAAADRARTLMPGRPSGSTGNGRCGSALTTPNWIAANRPTALSLLATVRVMVPLEPS